MSLSPLIHKYLAMYKANPNSRVFAPLAEAYRKIGLLDEAMKILKDGIQKHPSYVLGHLELARCYVDNSEFELAYTALRPFVETSHDNFALQNLFAEICLTLGHLQEALDTYNYLLFLNPKDKKIAEEVKKLESKLENEFEDAKLKTFNTSSLLSTDSLFDEVDNWSMLNMTPKIQNPVLPFQEQVKLDEEMREASDTDWVVDGTSLIEEESKINEDMFKAENPVLTHTLIDLYISQGHYDKAIQIIEKFIELMPDDEKIKDKLHEVQSLKSTSNVVNIKTRNESEGKELLMKILDETLSKRSKDKNLILKHKYSKFLEKTKQTALKYV